MSNNAHKLTLPDNQRQALVNAIVLISREEVERITGMSRAWIYQAMSENRFPRPVICSVGSRRWLLSEIQMWVLEKINERDMLATSRA
ncbi:helix-turn-helix transcriptional regulator [Pandoraea sp. NPDC087047]|uniref:helix-turn-helix transcriptional regulator n=1 Tax=Pandoraea sp. NPDC087047 TaxID=3364390 RepID=UPI00380F1C66